MNTFTKLVRVAIYCAILLLLGGNTNAQQLLDDFYRSGNSSNTVGTPTIGLPAWTEVQTSTSGNTSVNISSSNNSNLRMYSVSSSTGKDYLYRDCSSNYPTVINSSQYQLVWQFKMTHEREDLTGFNSTSTYGSAVILGSTSSSFHNSGDGYAIVLGTPSTNTDPLRLVRFSGGIANDASLASPPLISYGDFSDDDDQIYLAVKVVYTPSTNLWELFIHSNDDDRADFGDVSYASAVLRGSAFDGTFTSQNLRYVGALYNHGSSDDEFRMDEIYIPVVPTFYYSKATGRLDSLGTWGTNLNGSGSNPPNFTGANTFFNIRNGTTHTIGAAWSVSGSNSRIILGDSTNNIEFVIPPAFALSATSTIDVSAYSKLVIQNAAVPNGIVPIIGAVAFPSVVEYASTSTQTIRPAIYWDLICSSTGGRTWQAGTTGVLDTFVVGSNAFDNGTSNAVFDFMGAQTQYVPAVRYRAMMNSGNGDRIIQPSGIVEIRSDFTPSIGLYTVTGSTIEYSEDDPHTVPTLYVASGPNYNNLICSGDDEHDLESPMTIGGNLTVLDGDFNQNTGSTIFPLTINGDLILNGGDYVFADGTGANVLTLKGNLTQIGTSSKTRIGSSASAIGRITFAGNGNIQNISANDSVRFESCLFTVANGAYVRLAQNLSLHRNSIVALRGKMIVLSGGTFDCSTFRLRSGIGASDSTVFTLNSNATLVTANPNGVISSIIGANMIITYNNQANYKFNANLAQLTSLVNTNMKDLSIDNTANVTLNATINASGNINFINGRFNTTPSFRIIQGANGIVTGAGPGKYVNGTLEKFIALNSISRSFEIGDNNYYTPIDLILPGTTNGTGSLTATTTPSDFLGLGGSGIDPSKTANRHWTLINSGVTGFSPFGATFGFKNPNDLDPTANPNNFVVVRNTASTWFATTLGTQNTDNTQGLGISDFGSFQVGETTGPPVVTCPNDTTVDSQVGCSVQVNFAGSVSGNPPPSFIYSHSPNSFFPVGITTVTITSSNINGTTQCSFNITVNDVNAPTLLGCPTDIIANAATGECDTIITWTPPTAFDDCNYIITSTHNSGTTFPVGITTVSYYATDSTGNADTCSFNVTVIDNQLPVITGCRGDTTVSTNGSCGRNVSWVEPTATDNCSLTFNSNISPGAFFPVGTTTVTYTAIDSSGNTALCSFNVIVVDDEDPSVICPPDTTIYTTGACDTAVFFTLPAISDNCTFTVVNNFNPGDLFPVGITTVTYTVTDSSGNQESCSFLVTVINSTEYSDTACDSYSLPWGGSAIVSGDYTHIYTGAGGCDSLVTAHVTIFFSATSSFPVTQCDSVTLPWGLTVYTSGPYNFTYSTVDNCDSIVTANVTINNSTGSSYSTTVCDSLVLPWGQTVYSSGTFDHHYSTTNGCDSLVTANVTINYSSVAVANVTICDGQSYTPPGGTAQNTTGVYVTAILNSIGCDSVITTNLTVLDPVVVTATPGVILCNGGSTDVNVSATGGTGTYVSGTGIFNNQSAGSHTYTVIDDLGCSGSSTISISEPPALSMATCSATDVTCFGGGNGTVSAGAVSNGVGTVSYSWTNSSNVVVGSAPSVSGLPQGTYTLTVTDSCSFVTCTVVVNQPVALTMTACSHTDVTCNGGSDGTVSAGIVSGAIGPLVYVWKDGSNVTVGSTPTVGGLPPGIYTLAVKDNCSLIICSVIILEPVKMTITTCSKTDVTCNGGSDGSVTSGTVSGSVGTVNYVWTNSSNVVVGNTPSVSGLPQGTYTLSVTDSCGTLSCSITVDQPGVLSITSCSHTNTNCNAGSDGSVSAGTISNSVGTVYYSWTNSSNVIVGTTATVTGLPQGTYTLTVTDSCSFVTCTEIISQPAALSMSSCTHTDVTCNNGSDGSVSAGTVSGNIGPLQYSWTNSSNVVVGTSATVTGLPQGTYTLTVTDNCSFVTCIETISQPTALTMGACTHTDVTCNGGSDGSVSAGTVNGNVGALQYSWTNSSNVVVGTSATVTGLPSGTYTLTVTDNCSSVNCTEIISQPNALSMDACSHTDVTCNNGSDGSVSAGTVSNSVGTVSYSWTNSSNVVVGTSATVTGLPQGSYTLTVSDDCSSLNCTEIVGQPGALAMSACSQTDVTCNGGDNGTVSAGIVSNSVGTVTYTWTNSSNSVVGSQANISGLPQGTYTLTVSDFCSTVICSVTVNQPGILNMTSCSHTDVTCNGGSDGSVNAGTLSNSVGTVYYNWTNSSNVTVGSTATVTGLPQGTYTLTVTDSCSFVTCTEIISQPAALGMLPCTHTDVTCNGGSDGSVSAGTVSGNVGAIQYSWTNSSNVVVGTSATVTGLPQGTYTLTVTDNCSSVTCIQIVSQPVALSMSICTHTDVTCNGGSDGSVSAGTVSGNVGAIQYSWTNSSNVVVGTSASVTGLPQGTYTLTVTDNCSSVTCIQIVNQPNALSIAPCSHTNVTCNGGGDGSVSAGIVSNAVGPLTYTWTNSSNVVVGNSPFVSGLPQGTYTLTVEDNCSMVTCVQIINQPSLLSMTTCSHTDVTCNGGSDGTVSAGTVSNSVGPVLYSWKNSSNIVVGTTATVTGLPAGIYTLAVNDNCGVITCSQIVNQPGVLSMGTCTRVHVSCNGGSDGSVTAGAITNSVGTVNYSWTNSSNAVIGTSPTVNGLPQGTYTLTVTDSCSSVTCTVVLNQPGVLSMTTCSHTDVTCNGGSNGSVTAGTIIGSVGAINYSWTNSSNVVVGASATVTGLPAGTYTLVVSDNCSSQTCTQTINQPGLLSMTTCSNTNVSCFGGSNGTLSAGIVSNSVGPVNYTWRNSSNAILSTGPNAVGLPAGTYTLTVTDNCHLITCTLTITQPSAISMTATPGTIQCYGGNTCVTVTAGGGVGPYSGTGLICFFTKGTYVFTVTDANSCTKSASVTIDEPTAVTANTSTTPATCDLLNGTASVSPGGGTPGYSYLWSPGGQTTQSATGLNDGTYTVTVTDSRNCTGTTTAVVAALGTIPGTPGPVSGPNGACRNQSGVVYSIAPVTGATSYIWILPAGASGTSTTNSITVNFNNSYNGGNICVYAISFCGSSLSSCINVPRLTSAPATPGAMTGPLSLCPLTSATYSVPPAARATSYEWQVNNGMIIVSGQGTNSVVISAPAGFIDGRIRVRGVNCQGNSGWRTIFPEGVPSTPIWKEAPPVIACGGSCYYFNIDNVQDAVSWTLSAPAGCVVTTPGVVGSGNPFTSTVSYFRVCFPLGFISGNISIVSNNACGSSAALIYAIRSVPVQPSPITGSGSVCKSASNVLYTVPAVPNATSYTWSINGGGIVRSGQGTRNVRIRFTSVTTSPVTLSVTANNSCGVSVVRTRNITVNLNCKTNGEEISLSNEIVETLSSLSAFPNPSTGKVMITFNSGIETDCQIRVSDLSGRIIHTDNVAAIEGVNMKEINLEHVAKGMYVVTVHTKDNHLKSLRLIIE